MAEPTMGMVHAMIVTRQRRSVHFAAIHEKMKAASVDMTPVGMLNRDAFTPEKPSPLIINPPKVVSPEHVHQHMRVLIWLVSRPHLHWEY
jgi:hypothetical protein